MSPKDRLRAGLCMIGVSVLFLLGGDWLQQASPDSMNILAIMLLIWGALGIVQGVAETIKALR
jgi:hypothetical protein